ncbi:MAG TPA: cupin domain-containing protein, partial [Thermodesulfobacteriota bacterium]|nr:cupin domain-containing protein [Thermodesulfobacteriota bacterium]
GALDKEESEEIERLLKEGCKTCETELKGFMGVVDHLGYSAPLVTPPPDLKGRLLARVRRAKSTSDMEKQEGFLFVRSNEGGWKEVSRGVSVKRLFTHPHRQYSTIIVRMEPGARFPKHRHTEAEECYVLEGDIEMCGRVFRSGDYIRAEAGSVHEGTYSKRGCTLLILSSERNEILE